MELFHQTWAKSWCGDAGVEKMDSQLGTSSSFFAAELTWLWPSFWGTWTTGRLWNGNVKSSMQVSRTDLLIQSKISKISKQLCLCLLEIRWGHVNGFRRCVFDEEVRAIVQSCRTNMVPFMDVNNMNDYDMVNPAESKGVSKTNLLVFHLSTNICD